MLLNIKQQKSLTIYLDKMIYLQKFFIKKNKMFIYQSTLLKCVKRSIKFKWNLDDPCFEGGNTSFHIAAEKGNRKVINLLLEKGANVNCVNSLVLTPLNLAVRSGKTKTIKLLLKKGAKINDIDLLLAVVKSDRKTIKLLLKYGAHINSANRFSTTLLHCAVGKNDRKIIKLLLKCGAHININDIDTKGKAPIHYAVENGDIKIVELLLKYNAKIDLSSGEVTIKNGNLEAKILKFSESPFRMAVRLGRMKMAEFLLEKGANIDYPNLKGDTLLHIAARDNNTKLAEYLIKKGANINAQNIYNGYSPFHYAVENNHMGPVKLLLKYGHLKVNLEAYPIPIKPFHLAVNNQNKESAKLIIDYMKKTDPSAKKSASFIEGTQKYFPNKVPIPTQLMKRKIRQGQGEAKKLRTA